MTYEELKAQLQADGLVPKIDEALAPIREQQQVLATKQTELESQHTNFMASIMVPKSPDKIERKKGEGAARIIRALAASPGNLDGAARWAKDKWGDDEIAVVLSKGLVAGDATAGGFLVPEEFSSEMIELLRGRSIIRAMGPILMPMSTGVLSLPKLTGGATAEYIGEATAQNATEPTTGQLRLVWKKLRATVPVSNELLQFSSPSADAVVRDDVVNALATREDQAFIRDPGTEDKPKGIRYWAAAANVAATAGATAANCETDCKNLLNALEHGNCRMIRCGFLMAPRCKNHLLTQRYPTNGELVFPELRRTPPMIYGIPVAVSTNIPVNLGGGTESEVYLVDFADVVIGESTTLEVEVSREASYTDSSGTLVSAYDRDETVIKVISRHDLVVRHPESIAIRTGVTWGA